MVSFVLCALFMTSQFDLIFTFPNQLLAKLVNNMHILLHALPYFMCHCTEYQLSALYVRISEENKLNATSIESSGA